MKTLFAFMLVVPLAQRSCSAQLPGLQIIAFDRSGTLAWTNRLCTTKPVYEVQRAGSVTGAWERVAFVTNQTSITLTHPSEDAAAAAFYRVVWVDDLPLVFDYAFDEGYGVTAVTGRLNVALFRAPDAGFWACEETGIAIDQRHPTGTGQLLGGAGISASGEERVRLYLRPGVEGAVFLEGTLRRGELGGRCVYTECVGTVYEVTFVDTEAIGSFVATRPP
jgi:hypothetical protein